LDKFDKSLERTRNVRFFYHICIQSIIKQEKNSETNPFEINIILPYTIKQMTSLLTSYVKFSY